MADSNGQGLTVDATTIIAAAIGGIPALLAAFFAYKSSTRAATITNEANRLAATKVDADAYERSQRFYESLLNEAEKHIDRLRAQTERLNDQVDKLNNQLANEQDVSNVLRNQVRALTTQVGSMDSTLNDLRNELSRRST
jgi:chromosome segregation ATPase